jgi:hypothetical protein
MDSAKLAVLNTEKLVVSTWKDAQYLHRFNETQMGVLGQCNRAIKVT